MVEEFFLLQELQHSGDVHLPERLAVAEGQLKGGAFDVADQDGEVVGVDIFLILCRCNLRDSFLTCQSAKRESVSIVSRHEAMVCSNGLEGLYWQYLRNLSTQ